MSNNLARAWVYLAGIAFFILAIGILAKLFGCPHLWISYIFWASMTILAILSLILLLILPGGCSGDCEQGRKPCNCDNKWEK